MRSSSVYSASKSRNGIGTVQSAIGLITVERTSAPDFPDHPGFSGHVGDTVFAGDEIATGANSAVTIALNDGTCIRLSANARAVLNEPAGRPNAIASVALLDTPHARRRRLNTAPASSETAHESTSATPRRRTRDLGLRMLSLAVLAYSLLRDVEHARALSTDDDTISPKDSAHGAFEIITKSGTVIQVDDPALTYVVDDSGSVERHINSSARMEELQLAQQAVLGTLTQGFAGAPGSSAPHDVPVAPDLQPLTIPINFQTLDPIPERISPVFTIPVEDKPIFVPPVTPVVIPPAITTFSFDSGIDGDRVTNNDNLILFGTATPGTSVTIYDGGAPIGSTTTNANGVWSFNTGPLSDGEHSFVAAAGAPGVNPAGRSAFATFAALAVEAAPNTGSSAPYIVFIDTKAPDAPVLSVASGDATDTPTHDTDPILTIVAEAGSIVHVYRDGALIGEAVESDTPGLFTFASDALSDGCYSFTATATDIANNTSAPSCELKIDIDATAPAAPVFLDLVDHSCCSDDNLTDDPTPKLAIAAEAGSTVQVYRDGVLVGTAVESGKAGLFFFTSPELADGKHIFTATATDDADNLSNPSSGFTISVVTSDPNDFDELASGHCVTTDPDGTVHGTRHDDFIWFRDERCEPGHTIYAGAGCDYVKGTDQGDVVYGGSGQDRLFGNDGCDMIFGGFGDDKIGGGRGDDIIVGGYGADTMSGSTGDDTFVFLSEFDSMSCSHDTITDFDQCRDHIDVSAIDADAGQTGHQAFIFAGQSDAVAANSLTWHYDRHSDRTYILADTDGATDTAEIEIVLAGKVTLTHDNFVL